MPATFAERTHLSISSTPSQSPSRQSFENPLFERDCNHVSRGEGVELQPHAMDPIAHSVGLLALAHKLLGTESFGEHLQCLVLKFR